MLAQTKMRIWLFKRLPILGAFVLCLSCGDRTEMSAEDKLRAQFCKPVDAAKEFEETPFVGEKDILLSFQNIRSGVNSACMRCHMVPAKNGGFSYLDSLTGGEANISGVNALYPGFSEAAEKMRDTLLSEDSKKQMPPAEIRSQNPKAFIEIGRQLDAWIKAGKVNGSFKLGDQPAAPQGKLRPPRPKTTSELGDCVPTKEAVGFDYQTDREFETAQALPKSLTDTDLFSLDSFELARKGTLSYNVEYPLWADNANKGRWIHVPRKIENGVLKSQSISYDPVKKEFNIPENTRFYKSFYRAVLLPNGKTRMRRMETRLILTRTPWQKSLFGTYQWDDSEQVATLVETPYRDGTAWKDLVFDVTVDEIKDKVRPYAIPGRQRCIDCHMGSPGQNFVLGFQPLQINKRELGGAGREDASLTSDLDQVSRFISYGLLTGISSAKDLPVLESSGRLPASNVHELRAQGYMVGNCFHCHNPNGLAFTKENGIQLALGPGDIFGFNTQQRSVEIPTRKLVHQNGELDSSQIWRKVLDPPAQQGMFSQMPMNTPGSPDCKVLTVVGKWIRSFESVEAADNWVPECKKENPFLWIDTDFTWVKSEKYVPRREDWFDPQYGMPQKYRTLDLSPELQQAIQTKYAVGYWLKKPQCHFPTVNLPEADQRPWMLKDGQPKRPFGEVYFTTPGSFFFRNTCMKCHGPNADGNSALAKGILNWSGGSVRVANLIEGLFGNKNENLKTFDRDGKNYSGQYLIWMAMEGTRVRFPPELASFMGKHGGQMLNGIREKCVNQISSEKPSSPLFFEHEVFNKVCFMNNLQPGHPDLAYDISTNKPLHPEKVEEWADHAAWNAGWALFDFLKTASAGNWLPNNDQCEVLFSSHPERDNR
jgi:mono/diheme cytochrome c family protein